VAGQASPGNRTACAVCAAGFASQSGRNCTGADGPDVDRGQGGWSDSHTCVVQRVLPTPTVRWAVARAPCARPAPTRPARSREPRQRHALVSRLFLFLPKGLALSVSCGHSVWAGDHQRWDRRRLHGCVGTPCTHTRTCTHNNTHIHVFALLVSRTHIHTHAFVLSSLPGQHLCGKCVAVRGLPGRPGYPRPDRRRRRFGVPRSVLPCVAEVDMTAGLTEGVRGARV
jgi:hypothetical protein